MPKYDLQSLGHEEFERLCQSLLQQTIGPGTKIYGMGSDGAREATFHGKAGYPSREEQWDGDWIFQVKFHDVQKIGPAKSRNQLLEELNDELSKITGKYKIHCDNYILLTNVSLTPVFQKGVKDKIENEIIPRYQGVIKHIHILGEDEICRFLDAYPTIRQTYASFLVPGDIISRLLGVIDKQEDSLGETIKLYCLGCFSHEKYANLDDAGDVEDKRIELQNVFTDLDITPPNFKQGSTSWENLPEWMKQIIDDIELEKRTSALSYLFDDSVLGLVLIGGPGSGKSTLVRYISQIYRARLINRINEFGENAEEFQKCTARIPFLVLLKEYAQWISTKDGPDSLFHYLSVTITKDSGRDISSENIQEIIRSNPILLILDGLDEVPEKKLRMRVIDNVTSFVYQVKDVLKGNLRLIATTRPHGYSQEFDPECYLHLNLQKLSSYRANAYCRLWAKAREPNPKEADRIKDIFSICLNDDIVKVLTQSPLQVTILLVIIRARGSPPKQREELFERYTDIIYQREQKKSPDLLRTEQDAIYGLHKYLAYVLQRRAESDKTATLMDLSEFEERIKDYLIYRNPLLNRDELETKLNQIVTEARQRLVLIESPIDGKVGFDLTTTREFFAAAHLVDTAQDTKEKDLRFKAIATSPHWRNVALFFAGRVGRTRPGESSSIIDICRQIDTENIDKFLRRGAELVIDMIEDRVLREPHNIIGAIQFALTSLDKKFMTESQIEEIVNIFRGLSEEYRERVIRPWIEERLTTTKQENLGNFVKIYLGLYRSMDVFKTVFEKAPINIKFDIIANAEKHNLVTPWIIKSFTEQCDIIPNEDLTSHLIPFDVFQANCIYLQNSEKIRQFIANYLFSSLLRYSSSRRESLLRFAQLLGDFLLSTKFLANNKIALFAWGVAGLIGLISDADSDLPRDFSVKVGFPKICAPHVKSLINNNKNLIIKFCNVFSLEKDNFTQCFVAIYNVLLDPLNDEKLVYLYYKMKNLDEFNLFRITGIVEILFGASLYEGKESEYYKYLSIIYEYYKTDEQFSDDIKQINTIINKKSNNIKNNPQKIYSWINLDFDPIFQQMIDKDILFSLEEWLQHRGFSVKLIVPNSARVERDKEFVEGIMESIEEQIETGKKQLTARILPWIHIYDPVLEKSLPFKQKIRHMLKIFLDNYSSLNDPGFRWLEAIYIFALYYEVLDEKDLEAIYKIVNKKPDFFSWFWYFDEGKNDEIVEKKLIKLLKNDNLVSARLATITLSTIYKSSGRYKYPDRFLSDNTKKRCKVKSISSKVWELSKDMGDPWRPRYIEFMASCSIEWHKKIDWIKYIKEANTKELINAWNTVILDSDYFYAKDLNAFFDLLLLILESEIAEPIQAAALFRLSKIISMVEHLEFNENELNLPLPKRKGQKT